jgi:hypothetical protein
VLENISGRPTPLVGWRVWRLDHGRCLCSWAMSSVWIPGYNVAHCLSPGARCERSSGSRCNCGYWALNDPTDCLRLASSPGNGRRAVLGLIHAWGEIAIHGTKGFRAQHAAVACLFTDSLCKPPLVDLKMGEHTLRWRRWLRRKAGWTNRPPNVRKEVVTVAKEYGVPALPLASAIQIGLLEELGVGRAMIQDLHQKMHAWV